ncbi:alpha-ketoglutarate-dependent dioxygenase AlkB [Trinickia dabaoshanensis]|uniref:Alpha-ketoglutarate-dependent dioxygenase AlkB n=2 Tax=Trinickia dabaoshanensis TaxID=564714 RepID=A0A2N7VBA9_9BURK|nr:alpha-ketoglutarate-dependent dioxygenase AlkB [Trinickia dabaoshanensis]PMS14407.1 alpha-ketoglutarate-dependent dioxygenase AlkB [Trinickia dabaoshanensis]
MMDDMFGGGLRVDIDWYPHWLSPDEASVALGALLEEVRWKQDLIRTPGGIKPLPRLTAWQGEPGAVYVYSGIRNEPLTWTPTVRALKSLAETTCETRFNSVLLNRYRSGEDSMGWHADRERELGTEPVIASVSLGVARRFDLRHSATGTLRAYELTSGSLLVMRGRTQQEWRHRIAKVPGLQGERVNLTFRFVTPIDKAKGG